VSTPVISVRRRTDRQAVPHTYLMCRPDFFTVAYKINPWMNPAIPTDTALALKQWQTLYDTYLALGHTVELIDQIDGLPDMVYAANGGFVIDNIAYGARFTHPERQAEGPAYMTWFENNGFDVHEPANINEGEGDFMLVGDTILAGTGFRSASDSHDEVARLYGREVVTLNLVNPSFYHLDTAIAVLNESAGVPTGPSTRRGRRAEPLAGVGPGPDDATIAYLPSAFDASSRAELERRYPDAILVSETDAAVLGLNSISDGYNVVIASRAVGFEAQLRERGYNPIGVDLSELLLGGGGVKCCTLELRR
jgi:N-dimethylarginine dimethylaminohydrolase